MASITYRFVEFDKLIVEYKDLKVFQPSFLHPGPDNWYYVGPVAVTPNHPEQEGLIIKANEPTALDEVVDWEPVFIDIEGLKFSTWRGIPRKPKEYTVIGHFFLTGIEKPTQQQTAHIKAVRNDLISQDKADNLIWKERIPFAVVTLWTKKVVDMLHVPTGAFVSVNGDSSVDIQIALLRFNAAIKDAW